MKRKIVSVCILSALMALNACSAAGNENISNDSSEVMSDQNSGISKDSGSKELSGELVISCYVPYDNWSQMADAYMSEHPGVTIKLDIPELEGYNSDDYLQEYFTRIATGEIGDIVEVDCMDLKKGEGLNAYFENLYDYMDSDSGFKKEDYFSYMFEPMETDGELCALLRGGIPVYIKLNMDLLDKYGITYENDTIDFNGLSDLYQNVKEKSETTLYPLDYGSYEPLQMFDNTYFMENDCFDSAEYTDYVQKNRQMDYSNDYRVRQFYIGGGADPDVLGIQVVIEPTYTDIVENLFHTGDGLSEPVLYKGLHGESFIEPFKAAAISEKSQNKELAWDFLKFTISERYFDINDVGSISVNRKKARETLSGVDAEIIDRIIDDIDQVDTIPYNSAEWRNSVKLLYDQYYIEKSIDADQMAKMMQDRLFLYKNE